MWMCCPLFCIFSHEDRFHRQIHFDKGLSLLIKVSSSKLHSVPLGPLTKLLYWTSWGWECVGPPPSLLRDYLWHGSPLLGSTNYRSRSIIRPISSFSSDYLYCCLFCQTADKIMCYFGSDAESLFKQHAGPVKVSSSAFALLPKLLLWSKLKDVFVPFKAASLYCPQTGVQCEVCWIV